MAEDRHFRWRGAREECAPEWFGAWPLLPFRMFLSEKLVARRRQIQVLAQGTPRIFGTEETATLQFGNDQINEILEPFGRSEEHTSELQSLMRISYAVFCLKKKTNNA